ncbi:MAG: ABC transporter permease [Acidobacteriota bacterium]
MDSFFLDLKLAARQLFKQKGFLVTAGLTLALCIGANTTIFTVVNSVILRPLAVPEPERMVTMWNAYPGATGGEEGFRGANGAPDYFDRRALTRVFEDVAAYQYRGRSIDIEGTPQRVIAQAATPSFFPLLRAEAAIGRTFTEEEGEPGNDQVVVLSHGLWQQLYDEDPAAVGSELRIDGRPFTIVGIMPAGFVFIDADVRLWTALAFSQEQRHEYHSNSWQMFARLRPGVSLEQAQQRIDALNAANMEKMPQIKPLLIDAGFHTPLYFLQEDLVRDVRGYLFLLWGGVGFVLLIGCANVANLVLVRSTARAREMATRFALGAPRRRVVQQLLTETVLLTLMGGALGLLFGAGGLRALGALGVEQLPRAGEIRLDASAVAFTFALALAVGALVALIPLVSLLRVSLTAVFREEGRAGTAGRGVRILRKGMVAAQIALALVLLVGAGLLIASFRQLLAIDPGFEPQGVLTGTVVLTGNRYPEDADVRGFAAAALEKIRALPGVEQAGTTSQIPFGGSHSDSVIFAEGYVMQPGESAISPSRSVVTPGYFAAMGIRLLEGRAFDRSDTEEGRRVMVIDERLARRFWPAGDSLGKRMWRPTSVEDTTNPEKAEYFDIIGIVGPIKMRGLAAQLDATGAYYFPLSQETSRGLDLAIKTSGDPQALIGSVRSVIAGIDPELPLFDIHTMQERIDDSLTDRRTPMLLAVAFGAAALLLAAVGIYGVLAYMVQLRTREIGIRVALGSNPRGIFGMLLQEGLLIVALGLAVGLLGALGLRRLIESQLYGVSPLDPVVLGLVTALLAGIALAASLVPARRATCIDPVAALTQE